MRASKAKGQKYFMFSYDTYTVHVLCRLLFT